MTSKAKPIITAGLSPKHKMLVESAFKLFQKHGFKRVTVEEICTVADVSKVTFYRHYKGKEELIVFIIGSLVDNIVQDMNKIIDSKQSIKAKFEKISLAKQEFSHFVGEEMLRSIMLFPLALQQMQEFSTQIWEKLKMLLETEQSLGNINPNLDIQKTVKFLIALNNVYKSEEIQGIYDSTEDMIVQVNELLIMGLVARDTK